MNFKDFLQSSAYTTLLKSIGVLFVALTVFGAGFLAGYHQGVFSYHWNMNYTRELDDPRSPFAPFVHDGDETNSHGAIGTVVSINLPEILVKGPYQAESIVTIGSSTVVRSMHALGTEQSIVPGVQVIVVGNPDDQGRIQASFIRIMMPSSTTTSDQ